MLKGKMVLLLLLGSVAGMAQKVAFTEYDLDNGLHVVLHKDNTAPVVAVSVMYHVGSKDEQPDRTGLAHFFEHLLFEGSDNIKRGEFMKIVSSNGGQNNANTTQDRTFYYEVFPSNQLETGLWLESERLMHPVINEIGVKTQNEVVKEEKRLRYDNQPYGNFLYEIMRRLFTNHPYRWLAIGSIAHLDATTLDEFKAFNKKFYIPNNAVLVIAGDIDIAKTKQLVAAYFGEIPRGNTIIRNNAQEAPITNMIVDTAYDSNIQLPAIMSAYRTPGINTKESKALQLASDILSQGASSRMYKKMVDVKKNAVQVGAFNYALEDYGAYITYAFPNGDVKLTDLLADMDEEVAKLSKELISEKEFIKIRNNYEDAYVSKNAKMFGIAENLANAYTFRNKNTNYVNEELEDVRKITPQDIQDVVRKYLNPNQRVVLYYLPKK